MHITPAAWVASIAALGFLTGSIAFLVYAMSPADCKAPPAVVSVPVKPAPAKPTKKVMHNG